MDTAQIQQALVDIGFPIGVNGQMDAPTVEAVHDFQRGWSRGDDLAIDGDPGPLTQAALTRCREEGGKCGEFFLFREFKNRCNDNTWPKVNRTLVRGLDAYRRQAGPVSIVSAYRDDDCNAQAGGAPLSQHRHGNAADIPGALSQGAVVSLGVFIGVGVVFDSGLVVHVDCRHEGPNTTGGSPDSPTIWFYGGPTETIFDEEPGEHARYTGGSGGTGRGDAGQKAAGS
ncbi:MAG TPA: D-Ala-D-Ala carboxypeptidase family metallohydrolase [Acidimicrobiales bacterium]|nr:D-Ala-D-Ala carboxypeptidase family metallohydrolase [Acidimicrobiales bacterium]